MTDDRELDLVVYGATGFVGRLTAEYLARSAPDGVRIGLAGRSQQRLADLRDSLPPVCREWPLIEADSGDAAALGDLAGRTKVVATTVGPYRRYGVGLVEACARAGTHYADLTGEVLFIRDIAERFDAPARESGARIVTSCGFDSIPSDLGVLLLHERAKADGAGDLEDTTMVIRAMKGGASGGTIASMQGQMADVRADPSNGKAVNDPYALSPDREREPQLGNERDLRTPVRDEELGQWLGPFVMASINTRVVRRSNALQDWAYGRRFKYREVMGFPDSVAGRAQATALTLGLGALVAGLSTPPTRALLGRVLPSPGEGPSEEARAKGFFKIETHARTSSGRRYKCRITAQGDPGYAATAEMLGESGLCLALDEDRLPDAAGVLTPATAMGAVLVDRLRAVGHTYEVQPL